MDIPPEDRSRPTYLHLSTEGPDNELGVAWDTHQDCFKFGSFKQTEGILTKRKAMYELAGIFDPDGWLSPLNLTAKLIIQDLWRGRLDWDEQLPIPTKDNPAHHESRLWWVGPSCLTEATAANRFIQSAIRKSTTKHPILPNSLRFYSLYEP